ncbi:MAG: ParB/RepB/Spo0J family partition protein, partial [Gammaproteobacteria bacterium]
PLRPDDVLRELPVDLLQRGRYQPRVDMREETLAELADSIRKQGIVQPIVVRPLKGTGETRYEIIAGERRWRAAQLAGLEKVPAVIRDIPDEAAVAVALIENIQRENLNPLEEARALKRLIDEFDMTHAQAAEAVGRSRVTVSNLLRLLELPEAVRALVERRELDMGHARALAGITSPSVQLELANRIVREGWSVRETEKAIRRLTEAQQAPAVERRPQAKDPNIRRLEAELSERLGAAVSIEHGEKGGRIVIRYHSLDELDGIIEHIQGRKTVS